ncbi:hypothetical protein E5S67_03273 [Microcoleus sp. IPMA8]|uniref:Uncharacterized protein n=1 Tax=Microcoleus asticus IPMA8 TaxID=2563858 RepID=A0ABX2D073_9CYAN|nr:hypothetical protein [Microcoleus asticus IPMA8]
METGSGADTAGCDDITVGNAILGGVAGDAASGVSDAVGVGAGDITSGGVCGAASFFVPKTNSFIALPSGLRFLVLISALP